MKEKDIEMLQHTTWRCQYHIVFAPKYRRMAIYPLSFAVPLCQRQIASCVLLLIAGAFWAKGYYTARYVASDFYYVQVPEGEPNEDSWLVDADGVKQVKGKAYDLIGYNAQGEDRELHFTQTGSAGDYYAPGTFLKIAASETIVVGVETVEKTAVPPAALDRLCSPSTPQ